jgi:hypothetical protein
MVQYESEEDYSSAYSGSQMNQIGSAFMNRPSLNAQIESWL